jgi:hypothetical protein
MILTDQSTMPFGKNKGKTLEDVPASYLIWLAGGISIKLPNQRTTFESALLVYCKENADVLEQQSKESNYEF